LDDLAGEFLVFHLKGKTFLARISRMDTVTTCLFSRNRVLDFLRPAAAGGGVLAVPVAEAKSKINPIP